MDKSLQYLIFFLSSFILSLILTPLVRIFALKNGLVSHPRADRWHKRPTALLGGISIYLASLIPALFLYNITQKPALGLFLGGTFLFVVGLFDDKLRVTPYVKLFAQIMAGCIAIAFGIILGFSSGNPLSIPLTFLWIIGVTNSFNLLDNIDGLAGGIAGIAALMLFFSSIIFSNNPLGVYALILSGAVLGFLPYNFNPARIFMGDSGSMFLGYSLAVISISGTTQHISNLLFTMMIPVLILSVPIFDTIFVMVIRKLQGRRIFQGGKDHTSHHLVTLGFSQRKTVLLLYAISIVFGLIALLYSSLNKFVISIVAFLAVVILLFFGLFLFDFSGKNIANSKQQVQCKRRYGPNEETTVLNSILLHKRRMVEVILDFAFICSAYYTAYVLRFEGPLLESNIMLFKQSLVWIVLIKLSVFFIFGLYRGVWRYISISDFFTIFKVVSLSSAFSILALTFIFRFNNYSRAVFFMDWLILLFLVMGSRFLFRMMGEFLLRLRKSGKNIVILGAGDIGEMVVREIKRNKALDYNIVGFLDDDPSKTGNKIHGVPVLGGCEKIRDLAQAAGIEEVLIAISSFDADKLLEVAGICKEYGIPYRKIKGLLDS